MNDLVPETEAARLLSRQRALGSGVWVRELIFEQKIIFDTFENYRRICEADCGADCEGCAVKLGDVTLVLYHHGWDVARINYTLAHEVGHILLGHTGGPSDEAEANRFASALLIPYAPLRAMGRAETRRVAEFFGCSLTAAGYALRRANVVTEYDVEVLELFRDRLASYNRKENPLDISCDL